MAGEAEGNQLAMLAGGAGNTVRAAAHEQSRVLNVEEADELLKLLVGLLQTNIALQRIKPGDIKGEALG